MKKSAIIGTAAAAVLVAGGAIGGYAIAQNQATPEPTVQATTAEPTPEATEGPAIELTSEPTPEASAPVSVEPLETSAPLTPEDEFLRMAGEQVRGYGYEITDEQLLAAGNFVCEQIAANPSAPPTEIQPIDGLTDSINAGFVLTASDYLCP